MDSGMTFLGVSIVCAIVGVLVIVRPNATVPILVWLLKALFGRRCCHGCIHCRES